MTTTKISTVMLTAFPIDATASFPTTTESQSSSQFSILLRCSLLFKRSSFVVWRNASSF
ncbi:20467_t:CDS:2 [Gigaspora rosea]|nr:20467_t:CDS:2 [Gigaspora rosea]